MKHDSINITKTNEKALGFDPVVKNLNKFDSAENAYPQIPDGKYAKNPTDVK